MHKRVILGLLDRLGYQILKKPQKMPTKKMILDSKASYQTFSKNSLQGKHFYNIGAGSFYHPYWTNLDFPSASKYFKQNEKNFIKYDLMSMQPFPIESNSAEIVYSSHAIEHVTDEAIHNMLKESYRILKPGGCIRLTAPDAYFLFKEYQKNEFLYYLWILGLDLNKSYSHFFNKPLLETSIHQQFLHIFATQLCEISIDDTPEKKYSDSEISDYFLNHPDVTSLDYFTKQCKFNVDRPLNHINWCTHEKLISFLKEAGFSSPYASSRGQSVVPVLRDTTWFDSTRPEYSLYVEALKL